MKKQHLTLIAVLICIALIAWLCNTYSIVKTSKLDFYEKLEKSLSTSKTDTVVKHDTTTIETTSKPQIMWKDSIVEVPVLDSLQLQQALQSFYAKLVYKDSIDYNGNALLVIEDTVTQNKIVGRQTNLQIFKTDTIIKTVTNTIVQPSVQIPRNFIDAQLGVAQHDMTLYELSYMRQFGTKHLQWRLGVGVGNIWTDSKNSWFTAVKFGVAF